MGMYLSKYSMLQSLGYGDKSDILPEVKKALSDFKLFGFIIHDPSVHVEFHNKLIESFDLLDYISGRGFLFFALVDPPKSSAKYEKRDYFQFFETRELLSPYNAYKSADGSITSYSLAQTLGIDYSELPVILISRDFQTKNFTTVKTCSQHLEKQIQDIGYACMKYTSNEKFDDNDFSFLIKSIDLCGGSDNFELPISLAALLSDFIAFLVPQTNRQDYNKAAIQINKTIQRYFTSTSKSSTSEWEDKNVLGLLGMLSNLVDTKKKYVNLGIKNKQQSLEFEKALNYNIDQQTFLGLEHESKILYNTFEKIFPVYQEILSSATSVGGDKIDFTPLLISLCKLFEIEVNLSIVHWIREYLDIEMPLYFNKYKNTYHDYSLAPAKELVSSPRPINFNKGNKDKWVAPGIGESELIAMTLFKSGFYPKEFIPNYKQFLSIWSMLRQYRNNAAHDKTINRLQFNEAQKQFRDLVELKYLNKLVILKNFYKA